VTIRTTYSQRSENNSRNGKEISVGEVPGYLAGCVQEATDLCLVQIIRVDVLDYPRIPDIFRKSPIPLDFFFNKDHFFGIDHKQTVRVSR